MSYEWKTVYGSAIGTSHSRDGLVCQDAAAVFVGTESEHPFIVAVCSDGAGSASLSHIGSRITCDVFLRECKHRVQSCREDGLAASDIDEVLLEVRSELEQYAAANDCNLRDLACTILGVVATQDFAVFVQLGDGAIVVERSGTAGVVFWPQAGEYAGTTNFLTGEDILSAREYVTVPIEFDSIALFTDGPRTFGFGFQQSDTTCSFFDRVWEQLRNAVDCGLLSEALLRFLDSENVNRRTDDDKTLIVATRNRN